MIQFSLWISHGCAGPTWLKHLNHFPLLSQAHSQGAGLQNEATRTQINSHSGCQNYRLCLNTLCHRANSVMLIQIGTICKSPGFLSTCLPTLQSQGKLNKKFLAVSGLFLTLSFCHSCATAVIIACCYPGKNGSQYG